jgi:purine-nucleoside phosphorylase
MPVRVLSSLGIRRLILTNAAGALHPLYETGGLMLISDHINWTGRNPLTGPNVDAWGVRFPDMCSVYSPAFRAVALEQAVGLGIRLEQGVYAGVLGPCLETPAETRALRLLGADAVGMSTVTEAIAARHLGLDILGLSCLTNKNLPDCMAETSLAQVIAQAEKSSATLGALLTAVIPALP